MPTQELQLLDPFLFLNHHGPQIYQENNPGLPFGAHPHRGIETVTFIIDGDITHKDTKGHSSVIEAGGVQWMTAGSGLLHSEVSSDEFRKHGGALEILQLWINLPKRLKMIEPEYTGLQKKDIPVWKNEDHSIQAQVIAGTFRELNGALETPTPVNLSLVKFNKGSMLELNIPATETIFFYVVSGELRVNEVLIPAMHLAEFSNNSELLNISAQENSTLIFGHAKPFNEKVVFGGPFVMNSDEEIKQAYEDFHSGKMGRWS